MDYDFEHDRVVRAIRKSGAKRVLVQLPEGLKQCADKVMAELSRSGAEIILDADPCFGACDLREGFGLTVHYGHTQMIPSKKVVYVPCYSQKDVMPAIINAERMLPEKIGVVTTAQHLHKVAEAVKFLQGKGHYVLVEGSGQVLGCDASNAAKIKDRVDAFLYIGSGEFHPQMVSYSAGKKVVRANPYSGEADEIKQDWEKERYLRISKAMRAKSFGIVVGKKPGQRHLRRAVELRKKIRGSSLISMEMITPETIDYLPFGAFIITACPRIVLDDWRNYKKPILLADEAEEMQKMAEA